MADDIEQIKARLRDYEHIKYGSGLVLVKHANVLAVLDALAAAEKARDEAVDDATQIATTNMHANAAYQGARDAAAMLRADRDTLAALLRRADTTMEVAERLIDYFSNNRTSFSGSGTPASCRKDITTLRAEIETALAPRPSPTA